ncbi:putative ATPase/DNA-binding winged helix-turn-helix (wHTH) protein [Paraburkholderia sp. GAS199]|uniref:winged helix-turn-helix domain-containing protein n=1 Tax=Paraburkholderia sp. GAS199 TaxID=3035126 RepID=UPI003D2389D4
MNNRTIAFGPFRLYPDPGQLFDGEKQVHLGYRAIRILTMLVERAGDVVKHNEIVSNVWPDTVVEENNLRVQMSAIRKALRDGSSEAEYIYNIPGRGYQFSADDIRLLPATDETQSSATLPVVIDALVGRDEVTRTIADEVVRRRLVTIVGMGGIGKTSLAIAVGQKVFGAFGEGTCFLDLGGITNAIDMQSALHMAVASRPDSSSQLSELISALREKQLLVIFDNCEHLIEEVSALVERLHEGAPRLHVLATSREPLRARGEWVHRLAALECPPSDEQDISLQSALAFPAIKLFVERAKAAFDSFQVSESDGPILSRICHQVDGIPLAIEMAAARIDGFGLHGLVARMEDALAVLTRGRRAAVARQRTLKATLDWGYELLPAAEKVLLARLGVFRTSFTCDSAIAVVSGGNLSAADVADGIADLVAKSHVVMSVSGAQVSYSMLNTTRAYALEKLEHTPDADAVHCRHATHVCQTLKKLEPRLGASRCESQRTYLSLIEELRAALAWCFSTTGRNQLGWELMVASSYIWFHLSLLEEYVALVNKALNDLEEDARPNCELRMRLLVAVGPALYNLRGPTAEMRDLLERGRALAEANHDRKTQLLAMRGLWAYHHGLSEHAMALSLAEEYGRCAKTQTDAPFMFPTIKGTTLLYKGQLRRARKYLEYASSQSNPHISPGRGTYDCDQQVVEAVMLARIHWLQGNFTRATELAVASLQEAIASERRISIVFALSLAVCPVYLWSGNLEAVEKHVSELERLSVATDLHYWYQYAQVFRASMGQKAKPYPADRRLTGEARSGIWGPRHIEEFSVLPKGFVSPALVTRAHSSEPLWCSAENLRSSAMKYYEENGVGGLGRTIDLLGKSLDVARRQGALAWELRTSTSLAGLLRQQNRCFEARNLIERVVARLNCELWTRDCTQANLLLESLS